MDGDVGVGVGEGEVNVQLLHLTSTEQCPGVMQVYFPHRCACVNIGSDTLNMKGTLCVCVWKLRLVF